MRRLVAVSRLATHTVAPNANATAAPASLTPSSLMLDNRAGCVVEANDAEVIVIKLAFVRGADFPLTLTAAGE